MQEKMLQLFADPRVVQAFTHLTHPSADETKQLAILEPLAFFGIALVGYLFRRRFGFFFRLILRLVTWVLSCVATSIVVPSFVYGDDFLTVIYALIKVL